MQDGFVKVAAVAPRIRVGDVAHNIEVCLTAAEIMAQQGARVVVCPELCLTGSTCGDLFWQDALLEVAERGLVTLAERLGHDDAARDAMVVVGAPLLVDGSLYNCAVVLQGGAVRGVVPKRALTYAEARWFTAGPKETTGMDVGGALVGFGANQLFGLECVEDAVVAVVLGNELGAARQQSQKHAVAGATIVVNPAALPVLAGHSRALRVQVEALTARLRCAYVFANAGGGESTTDYAFGGQCLVAERGHMLDASVPFGDGFVCTEVDVACLAADRRRMPGFASGQGCSCGCAGYAYTALETEPVETTLTRPVNPLPFIPQDEDERAARCEEILAIQAHALAERMRAIGSESAVIGISGGLDSTLALIVTARAFELLELDCANILAVTMPGFGTTDRTHNNAWQLALALGATPREIAIGASVRQHFADIGHSEDVHNATYENAQARERTQILMDVANDIGGIVVGTGDLSELALGWATYNGDHMSMYAVNASVSKTLIRCIVRHVAKTSRNPRVSQVLIDVVETPVSPELLPANEDGTIAQQTEDLVGPYELHDFFLYHTLRWGSRPRKVLRLARHAFAGTYDDETIRKWLKVFYRRFFSQQFKRSCSPDGPAAGSIGLSPRGGLVMPSDAASALWLAEL